jgi:hypothetical protein
MEPSALLKAIFEPERLQTAIEKAQVKELPEKDIRDWADPDTRLQIFSLVYNDQYSIFPPTVSKIPKDTPGEYREVYINQPRDRILLILINDALCEMFSDMIHPACTSYQKGLSTQKTVRRVSEKITAMKKEGMKQIGYKTDFSKYFDSVCIEKIDAVWDTIEQRLGFEKGTEPVLNLLRRYYHQDIYFDSDQNLQHKYQSLKQGCSVASFLANVLLYDLDEYMSNKYEIYYRYSDDIVVADRNFAPAIDDINRMIEPYGIILNPKKVEPIYSDKWFKFLGFYIRGNQITLSKKRVKTFQKEVAARSIDLKKCSAEQAQRNIMRYLFKGEHCWASSCLSVMNVKKDLNELNNYIMDCIRACETGKKQIGGLGSNLDYSDHTIQRGKGRNVKANRLKTDKMLDDYVPLTCLAKDYKYHRAVFDAVIRDLT